MNKIIAFCISGQWWNRNGRQISLILIKALFVFIKLIISITKISQGFLINV